MTVFASFVNKLKKQLKFPALQGVGSNRSKYRDFTSRSLFLSIKLHNWSWKHEYGNEIEYESLLGKVFFHYLLVHCAFLCRSLVEQRCHGIIEKMGNASKIEVVVWSWNNAGWVACQLDLSRTDKSGSFYSPPARAHVVEKSGCPCPGWSRSKLAG